MERFVEYMPVVDSAAGAAEAAPPTVTLGQLIREMPGSGGTQADDKKFRAKAKQFRAAWREIAGREDYLSPEQAANFLVESDLASDPEAAIATLDETVLQDELIPTRGERLHILGLTTTGFRIMSSLHQGERGYRLLREYIP